MKIAKFAWLFPLILAGGQALFASTLAVNTLPANTYMGHYVGPAAATLDGLPVWWVCDDFVHTTYVPSGDIGVDVSTIPSLTNVRFTQVPELQNYQQASILVYEMGLSANANLPAIGDIQLAIWKIFDPGDSNLPFTSGSTTWLGWVGAQDLAAWDYSNVKVLTPTRDFVSNQEGLVGGATPTPEPGSIALLFGGGLALIATGRIRRRRR